jgi:hypothetical protein
MIYTVKINSIKSVDELEGSWNNDDFTALLRKFDFAEAERINQNELRDYLFMAISDFEPTEAARLILEFKLSEVLTEGQIDNLSHEMMREKVSENYSDINLHKTLFSVNQLLYKAYNGKFPATRATVVNFEMKGEDETELSKEIILMALRKGLSENNLINRLLKEQLDGNAPFPEAEGIVWDIQNIGNSQYQLTTSEKWVKKDDFENMEFECSIIPYLEISEQN